MNTKIMAVALLGLLAITCDSQAMMQQTLGRNVVRRIASLTKNSHIQKRLHFSRPDHGREVNPTEINPIDGFVAGGICGPMSGMLLTNIFSDYNSNIAVPIFLITTPATGFWLSGPAGAIGSIAGIWLYHKFGVI